MNKEKMERAEMAAFDFIQAADALLDRLDKRGNWLFRSGRRETRALRRQSLELTRALAELRLLELADEGVREGRADG